MMSQSVISLTGISLVKNSLLRALHLSFSHRFSAIRDKDGIISYVLYPPGEPHAVLAFKKTLAKLFSIDTDLSVQSETEEGVVLTNEWVETEGDGATVKQVSKTTTVDSISGAVTDVVIHEQVSSETQNRDSGIKISHKVRLSYLSVTLHTGVLMGQAMESHSTLSLVTQHPLPVVKPHRPHNLIHDDIIITSSVHYDA